MHRIAYYLYRYRDTLRANRIFILSPNKVFGDYISTVLPELGEEPIRAFTIDELTERLLPKKYHFISYEEEVKAILSNPTSDYAKRVAVKSNGQFVMQLKAFLNKLELLKNQDVTVVDYKIDAKYIQNRFATYKKEPVMERLKLIAEDILSVLESKFQGEMKLPRKNEVVKQLKSLLCFSTLLALYKQFMAEFDKELFHFTKNCFEFSDVYPYLYCQQFFEGIEMFELVQHFVLDEMQDYTPIQYAKGLEFDAVIVPFVDEIRYKTDFDQGLLYIATTRVMHELTMLVDQEKPSKLL